MTMRDVLVMLIYQLPCNIEKLNAMITEYIKKNTHKISVLKKAFFFKSFVFYQSFFQNALKIHIYIYIASIQATPRTDGFQATHRIGRSF